VSRFNPAKARYHLVQQYKGVTSNKKKPLQQGTQANKRKYELHALTCDPSATIADIRFNALTNSPNKPEVLDLTSTKRSISSISSMSLITTASNARPKKQYAIDSNSMLGPTLTEAAAEKIILAEVKAMVARGEPVNRLLDPYVRAAIIARNPAIAHFLPRDVETIFSNYVVPIDQSALEEMKDFIKRLPGFVNISLDGATINGKQKVRKEVLLDIVLHIATTHSIIFIY